MNPGRGMIMFRITMMRVGNSAMMMLFLHGPSLCRKQSAHAEIGPLSRKKRQTREMKKRCIEFFSDASSA